jgi:hypothetical protein
MELSLSLEANSYLASQENSLPFMEPEDSLPCSKVPTTGPYPDLDESISHPSILFP